MNKVNIQINTAKKIAVIDDDKAILEVIRIILEEQNYLVTLIDDPNNVLKKIQDLSPALILMDLWMSGYDGMDITKQLKKDDSTKHIPIIIISANNDAEKIAKESGANGFLPKPFDIDDLAAVVKQHLST